MQASKRRPRRTPGLSSHLAAIATILCVGALPSAAAAASRARVVQPLSSRKSTTQPYMACPLPSKGRASCLVVVVPPAAKLFALSRSEISPATSGIDGSGLAPSELQAAYKLPSSTAGGGQTVAIVDAYDDAAAEADLATYRSAYGLEACTTANGCFSKVSQTGSTSSFPSAEPGWDVEISLDMDMVSAICPKCHVMLVEANSSGVSDLLAAEDEAASRGATAISNSWGTPEFSGEASSDSAFVHAGIPITAASGDWGYDDHEIGASQPSYPAASPDVIAVGGTTLTAAGNTRGWSESVWAHSGSGCSLYEPKPAYQTHSGCARRTANDISAVAEGLSIYDSGQSPAWFTVGGTSAASPIIASVEAMSSSAARALGAAAFYQSPGSLFDVPSGSNGSCGGSYLCTAEVGYDAPTGVGTPDGAFPSVRPAPTVTSLTPDEGTTLGATTVTIAGSGFVKGATVKIGRSATAVTIHSETEITAKTSATPAGSDEVVVSDTNGTSSGGAAYTYVTPPKPTVTSITPNEGTSKGGATVTITGSGFLKGATVKIGSGASSVTVHSETEITAKTAATPAGTREVVVSDLDGTSSAGPTYTYVAPPKPTVTSLTPSSGTTKGGTVVRITGTGLLKGATVKIGSGAISVTVRSETEITAKTTATAPGTREVIVTDSNGTSTHGPSFTYVAPAHT
jgi:hypothetical protein